MLQQKLTSEKGNLLKLTIKTSKNDYIIEPLKNSVSGVVIDVELYKFYFSITENIKTKTIYLIDNDAKIIKARELEGDEWILSIESFVLYPDGTTWTGPILQTEFENLGVIIWTKELASKMRNNSGSNIFVNEYWENIPTIAMIRSFTPPIDYTGPIDLQQLRNNIMDGCSRIEHTCNDCDKSTKPFTNRF